MNRIFEEIKKAQTILIMTHENPDGDAIGSTVALYEALKNLGKDVDMVVPSFAKTFNYLNSIDKIKDSSMNKYDLGFVLDCANYERIGQNNCEFDRCKTKVVIDHHISNANYGDINHIEPETASCTQVLYYLFKEWGIEITTDIGEALITGSLTDTAGYSNNNVDKFTFMMAADLIDIVDIHKIYYQVLLKKSMAQYNLMKMTLERLELLENGKIAFSYITEEDIDNYGVQVGEHEGLIDLGRNIDGVEVSIFMREDDGYRVSFRSNGAANVSEIAKKFGGGGHIMAAGAKIDGSFKETKDKVLLETKKELGLK